MSRIQSKKPNHSNPPGSDEGMEKRAVVSTPKEKKAHATEAKKAGQKPSGDSDGEQ